MLSPDELKGRARRLVEEVVNQGDLVVARELVAEDLVHHVPGVGPELGMSGIRRGLVRLRRAFPDHHAVVEDEIAEGDRVVQRLTARGTHRATFHGIAPTDRVVTYQVVAISRAGPDGRFVERWSSIDLFGLVQQLTDPAVATARTHHHAQGAAP